MPDPLMAASHADVLVVGAGLWGCVAARELADAKKKVLILEARSLPGGNSRSQIDPKTGIECHCDGSHIFHTSDEGVWRYLNRFVSFTDYRHKVLTVHAGRVYAMPLGLALVNAFYQKNLKPFELRNFIAGEAARDKLAGDPQNLEEQAVSLVGRPLYEAFIREYTRKQWNADPKTLAPSIIRRLPVRTNYNIDYFDDPHQGIPRPGYSGMFRALLDHPNIQICYNTDYLKIRNDLPNNTPVFYSGPVDAFFNYQFGPLPWRGLQFEWETKNVQDWQGTTVMNYADPDVPYTRIHEFKHFHPERTEVYASQKTVICREYPANWKPGNIPYYPVETKAAETLWARYQQEQTKSPNVIFGGRLGEYKYYNMDKVVRRALDQTHSWLASPHNNRPKDKPTA